MIKRLTILAGLAIMCILTTAFAAPAQTYAQNGQDGKMAWLSNPGNCTRNCISNGSLEFNRELRNGTTKIQVITGGRGFALNGDQFHVVNMAIKSMRTIDAAKATKIRDLLKSDNSNKTIGELKKDVLAIVGEPVYNGSLKFGQSAYKLVNMNVATTGNKSSLDADLSSQAKGAAAGNVAGHIKLTTETQEGSRVSSGDLTLNGTSYRVLIDMMPLQRGFHGGRLGFGIQPFIGARW